MRMLTEDVRRKILGLDLVGFTAVPAATNSNAPLTEVAADGGVKASLTKSGMVKSGLCKVGLAHR